jgi:hypothetical protein
MTTETIVTYADPFASPTALTRDERARLRRVSPALMALLEEQMLAEAVLAETPSVTGRALP